MGCISCGADQCGCVKTISRYGKAGKDGGKGAVGKTGPAPTLQIGTVTTLASGASATASIIPSGTPGLYTLNLGIPKGADGAATLATFSSKGVNSTPLAAVPGYPMRIVDESGIVLEEGKYIVIATGNIKASANPITGVYGVNVVEKITGVNSGVTICYGNWVNAQNEVGPSNNLTAPFTVVSDEAYVVATGQTKILYLAADLSADPTAIFYNWGITVFKIG